MTQTARRMVDSRTMPPPVAVVDALNSLLEAEQGSVFRFMGEGSPYLSRASADGRSGSISAGPRLEGFARGSNGEPVSYAIPKGRAPRRRVAEV